MGLWVWDMESDGLLDEITYIHVIVMKKLKSKEWKIFVDKERYKDERVASIFETDITYELRDLSEFVDFVKSDEVSGLICHNQIRYDLPALEKLGYIKRFEVSPDSIDGSPTRILDTLVMSQGLYPDRPLPDGCPTKVFNTVSAKFDMVGPHGLMAWAYRTVGKKPQVDDWRNQPLFVYMDRCVEDVKINEGTWYSLVDEASNTEMGIHTKEAISLDHSLTYRLFRQAEIGVAFHTERAQELVFRCDTMMKEIENKVEPVLPERTLPKSQQPNFPAQPFKKGGVIIAKIGYSWLEKLGYEINWDDYNFAPPPKTAFKQSGEIGSAGEKYAHKNGYNRDTDGDLADWLRAAADKGNKLEILKPEDEAQAMEDLKSQKMPPLLTEPMRLANQIDLKIWLVKSGGWVPTMFTTKDVTKGSDKKPRSEEEVREKLEEYVVNTVKDSPYREYIAEILGVKINATKDDYLSAAMKNARALPSSPKFKDERGELCPDLERLEGDMVRDIVKWLSLRSRRTTLLPLSIAKTTGWLNNPRVIEEGRLAATYHGFTNTMRLKHIGVRNVPKASEEILLGHEFRDLFYAPVGKMFQTLDAANMEALIGAWLAFEYDDGELWRLATGGGDTHARNAEAYSVAAGREVKRGEGKGITYGVMYGAQKAKVAKMLGISLEKAQAVIDAYWDTNEGLKAVKEYLEKFWERTNKKYIQGIDGRRIYTRSKHSLLNAMIQSTGAIMMSRAYCKTYDKARDAGILENTPLIIFYHDEISCEVDRSLIEMYPFATEDEAKEFNIEGKVLSEVKEFKGRFWKFYSPSGEMTQQAVNEASTELGSPYPLTGDYAVGPSWAYTH